MSDVYPSFYRHGTHKARKVHWCCECNGAIQPEETYHYHSGLWDGAHRVFKVCAECEALRDEIDSRANYYEDQVSFEELSEHVFNGSEQDWIDRFVANKERRGAEIQDWMLARTTGGVE